MPDVLVRNLSAQLRDAIKDRAHRRGHSVSDEIKSILSKSLGAEAAGGERLGTVMVALFQDAGPVDLEFDRKSQVREPPEFS